MTDATPAPAPAPAPGVSDLLGEPTPEIARETIRARIDDPDFRKKLLANDPATRDEWNRLHKIGFRPPAGTPTTIEPASEQARRENEQRERGLAALAQQGGLSALQISEIRNRMPVTREEHDYAVREKDRMIKDAGFRQRLLSHDRAAANEWFRVVQLSALPVKP
jgi:hypothetical protein